MAHRVELRPPSRLPRACVVGAGCSGLTTIKALRDAQVPHLCFEMSNRVGGNWVFGNENGRSGAYRSLHVNTSKDCMGFEDFPMPAHFPDFPHHTQLAEYFESYAKSFGLHESIRFRHEVLSCRPLSGAQPGPDGEEVADSGGWAVTVADRVRGTTEEHVFDALIVANGHHWDPAFPDPMPEGSFRGVTLHSHAYVDPQTPVDLRGKRVVVVGMGNSAMDIAAELCRRGVAERLFLSGRRGAWIIPKYIRGKPLDQRTFIPTWLPEKLRLRLVTAGYVFLYGRMRNYGLPEPDHLLGEAHPTVSSEVPTLVGLGDIVPKPAIVRFEDDHVHFADGSRERVDAIIYCTGYHVSFPFFEPEVLAAPNNELPLFLRVFDPRYQGLCLIGFAQPHGAIMPLAEQQARWVAEYLKGTYALPSKQEMLRHIEGDRRWLRKRYVASRRHTLQIDPERYLAELCRERRRGRKRARSASGRTFRPHANALGVER